jgi:hypothetical protein
MIDFFRILNRRDSGAHVVSTESFNAKSNPPLGRSAFGVHPGILFLWGAELMITQNRVGGIAYPGFPPENKSRWSS